VAHRLAYLIAQGQGGIRSGVALGIPFKMDNNAAANGAIPVAAYPVETAIWVAPALIAADAFVSTLFDGGPLTPAATAGEPLPTFAVQAVRTSFNAAFAAAAASFKVLLRRWTAAAPAVLVGTVATIVDATATTLTAMTRLDNTAITNSPLNVGDILSVQIVVAGAGAACPAFGGTVDVQG
jgi:hypothetical protein